MQMALDTLNNIYVYPSATGSNSHTSFQWLGSVRLIYMGQKYGRWHDGTEYKIMTKAQIKYKNDILPV